MNRVGLKCVLAALALLLCVAAIGNAAAQGIQLRKQTREIPLPVPAKPRPAAMPEATPAVSETPAALGATQLFNKASPSVVVVEATDADGKTLATGSGVVVSRKEDNWFTVATNCHVVDTPGSDGLPFVSHGRNYGVSRIMARDAARDLCLLTGALPLRDADGKAVKSNSSLVYLPAPPVAEVAPLRSLEIGERVYAIGAPQGLELSLSEGLVSGLRKDSGTTLIQTTAAISKGSSGGGLFDAQGRLVGITTMYLKDSQALNFAVPAELIADVPDAFSSAGSDAAQAAADAAAATADAAVAPPPRDRWVEVGGSDSSTAYVDTQTLQRNGTDVTVWVKFVLDKPKTDKTGDTYDEELKLTTYHCASRQFTRKVASQHLRGNPIWSHEYKSYEQERKSVMPDTVGEAVLKAVCNDL